MSDLDNKVGDYNGKKLTKEEIAIQKIENYLLNPNIQNSELYIKAHFDIWKQTREYLKKQSEELRKVWFKPFYSPN